MTIGHERIVRGYQRLAAGADVVVVEGAGGWHAPITASETMADVAEKLAVAAPPLSVILVVGLRLGCLNHALLTREAIRSRSLPLAGWIANKMHAEMPLADANIETLAARLGAEPIAVVPAGWPSQTDSKSLPSFTPAWASEAAKSLVSH